MNIFLLWNQALKTEIELMYWFNGSRLSVSRWLGSDEEFFFIHFIKKILQGNSEPYEALKPYIHFMLVFSA